MPSDENRLKIAFGFIQENKMEEARSICGQVLENNAGNADAALLMSFILLEVDDYVGALSTLRVATLGNGHRVEPHLLRAQAAEAMDAIDLARWALKNAMIVAPDHGDGYQRMVRHHGARREWPEAERMAIRSTRIEPGNPRAWRRLGRCFFSRKRTRASKVQAIRANLLDPGDSRTIGDLAEIEQWIGSIPNAARLLRRLCIRDPGSESVWRRRGVFEISRKRHDLASTVLRRALILAPANIGNMEHYIHASRFTWSESESLRYLAIRAVGDPGDAVSWITLASALRGRGDIPGMQRAIKSAASTATSDPLSLLDLSFLAFESSDTNAARVHFRAFLGETFRRLAMGSPSARLLQAATDVLGRLIWAGNLSRARQVMQRINFADLAGTLVHDKLVILEFALATLTDRPNPTVSRERPDASLIVSIPVWGDGFTDLWLSRGLPSLLSDGGIRLWKNRNVTFQIFSTPVFWRRITDAPVFRAAAKHVSIEFIDISPVLDRSERSRSANAMRAAHWTSLCMARSAGSDLMILVADYVFGDQALAHVDERLRIRDKDLLCTNDLWISGDAIPYLSDGSMSMEHLNVPHERLLELFISYPSKRLGYNSLDLEEKKFPADPTRLVHETANGYEIRTLQPQAFVVLGTALRRAWFHSPGATDSGFADSILHVSGDETRQETLSNPKVFTCAVLELLEDERAQNGHYASRIHAQDPIVDLTRHIQRCGLTTQARILAFHQPLLVSKDQACAVPMDEDFGTLLDGVPMNNYPAVQHAFMNEIGEAILAEIP
jgi:tetratricopeptide (TPR) repeat protein